MKTYRYLYPFPTAELAEIAYFYEYEFADGLDPRRYIEPTLNQLSRWREAANQGAALKARPLPTGALEINDTRPGVKRPRTVLRGWRKDLYDFCDQARPIKSIRAWIKQCAPAVSAEEIQEFLDELLQFQLIARDEDRYLSLAVAARAVDCPTTTSYGGTRVSAAAAVASA
jgi:hypothetical protein